MKYLVRSFVVNKAFRASSPRLAQKTRDQIIFTLPSLVHQHFSVTKTDVTWGESSFLY